MRVNKGGACDRGLRTVRRQLRCARDLIYDDGRLIYATRMRNGFTPKSRMELFK